MLATDMLRNNNMARPQGAPLGGAPAGLLSPKSAQGFEYKTKAGRITNWSNMQRKQAMNKAEMYIPGYDPRREPYTFLINI